MTDWKIYKILKKDRLVESEHKGSCLVVSYVVGIKFSLDDYVNYNGGSREKFVSVKNFSDGFSDGFVTSWDEGDYIEINNDRTCYKSKDYVFGDTGEVKFFSSLSYTELFKRYSDLKGKCERLEKENSRLERKLDALQDDRDEWKGKFEEKNEELYREKLRHVSESGNERERHVGEKTQLQTENTRLQEKLESANAEKIGLRKSLKDKEEENSGLLIKLGDKDNQLTVLRIESGEKDSKLQEKEKELTRKNEEIKHLKSRVVFSREEILTEKLRSEKENLKLFATELKINLEQVRILSKSYERLTMARKTRNQANIDTHEENIARVEERLCSDKVSMVHIQEICRKCERIAELNWELNQVNQRQSADTHQEKDWRDINPNFTPTLVQEWKKYGFTYEECADWINIGSPTRQSIAIKEPAYHAWLRDIKKVDAEWILNEGNQQELNQEYLKWYQEQEQQQFENKQEVPTNN
jgi:hypothetical protein